jgi:hypothetical protein
LADRATAAVANDPLDSWRRIVMYHDVGYVRHYSIRLSQVP